MILDLDLARKKDSQNPVYYVQYAHARICSILRQIQNKEPLCDKYEKSDFFIYVMIDIDVIITDENDIIVIYASFLASPDGFFRNIKGIDFLCVLCKEKSIVAIACRHIDNDVFFIDQWSDVFVNESIIVHI